MCLKDSVCRRIDLNQNVIDTFLFLKREEEAWVYKTVLASFEYLFRFQDVALNEIERFSFFFFFFF